MISEARMIHELWNFLEREGYDVAGEVRVVSDQIRDIVCQSKSFLDEVRSYIDNSGNIKFRIVRDVSTIIDLVATDGTRFIGFEVKDEFEEVTDCISRKQLEHYITGGALDEVYLVVPTNEAQRVERSYGHYLESVGVGLIALGEGRSPEYILRSSTLRRISKPLMERNEAWLRQAIWTYFEREYCVEGEYSLDKLKCYCMIYVRLSRRKASHIIERRRCIG